MEDLLGLRGPHVNSQKRDDRKYHVLVRLVEAICNYSYHRNRNIGIKALNLLGHTVLNQLIKVAMEKEFNYPNKRKPSTVMTIAAQDLKRALAWVEYFTYETEENTKEPHRKITF